QWRDEQPDEMTDCDVSSQPRKALKLPKLPASSTAARNRIHSRQFTWEGRGQESELEARKCRRWLYQCCTSQDDGRGDISPIVTPLRFQEGQPQGVVAFESC